MSKASANLLDVSTPSACWVNAGGSGEAEKQIVPAMGRAIHRANRHQFVHHACQPRQVLAYWDARHIGGDRLKLAADFGRRIRLEIEHVLVRRSAAQVDHD